MFERLGKKKYIIPFLIIVLLGCMFSLMFYPMTNMEIKGLPFVIVSLDEGVETEDGDVNIGDLVVDTMTESTSDDGETSAMSWTRVETQEELDAAMDSGDYYGAIVIPADYSQATYDTLLDTMSDQIGGMTDTMMDSFGDLMDTDSLSDGFDLSSMMSSSGSSSATATSTDDVELSDEAQTMIAAASQNADNAMGSATSAATTYQSAMVRSAATAKVLETAQETLAEAAEELEEAQTALEAIDPEEDPDSYATAQTTVEDLENVVNEAELSVEELTNTAAQAQEAADQAAENLQNAQANAQTAAINAASVSQVATSSSTLATQAQLLATQAQALQTAVSSISDLASSMSDISFEISDEQIDEICESVASESLNTVVETLESASDDEDEEEEDEGAVITVYLDKAKSPMIASSMESSIASMFTEMGVSADVEMLHEGSAALAAEEEEGDDGDSSNSTNAYGMMMGLQIAIMPLVMLSIVGAMFISRILRRRGSDPLKKRVCTVLLQLVLLVAYTLCVAVVAWLMLTYVSNTPSTTQTMILTMWLACFSFSAAVLGLADISFGLGLAFGLCSMALGMSMAMLPYEVLPTFWQNWVWPWAPQHYIGEAVRDVLYLDTGVINSGSSVMCCYGIIGVVIALLSMFIPALRKRRADDDESADESDSELTPSGPTQELPAV